MTARARAGGLAILGVVTFAACGGSATRISPAARARLVPLVERVRRAAEALDRPATRQSLSDLRTAVAAAEERGDLSSAYGAEILTAADQVERRLDLLPAPTTTTTAPADDSGPGGKKHERDKHKQGADGGGND